MSRVQPSPLNRSGILGVGSFLMVVLSAALLASTTMWAERDPQKALQVFFVDVEGGQSTLFVTPAHQSLLIDTGWPGNDGRDADRIVAAAKKAGIAKIDYILITHFHNDHVGGLPQLWPAFRSEWSSITVTIARARMRPRFKFGRPTSS